MERKEIIAQCFYCGNKGKLEVVGMHENTFGGSEYDDVGNEIWFDAEQEFKWYILSCPICHNITLYEENSYDYAVDKNGNIATRTETDILYPVNNVKYHNVPEKIKTSFEAALKVNKIDSAVCLMALRKTLEEICNDMGAEGKTLYKKVEDLVIKKVLPSKLNDASGIIRTLGNMGAHCEDVSQYSYYINQVIEFLELIINYLYELPYKIDRLKMRIEENKKIE